MDSKTFVNRHSISYYSGERTYHYGGKEYSISDAEVRISPLYCPEP
jgi:hypothetical protein